jgi:Fe-Mn family superoxide dismutase
MEHQIYQLPYAHDALEPHISSETIDYHYGKHHQSYATKLNGMIKGTEFADKNLDEIVKSADGGIFNNAAQVWNHNFYWQCLSPDGGGEPEGDLAEAINKIFGSFKEFKDKFSDSAAGQFGSGWAWLVKNSSDDLEIVSTSNADTPLRNNQTALLTCDVWEHAYYIDYRNARPDYIEAFWNLVNWKHVSDQFGS